MLTYPTLDKLQRLKFTGMAACQWVKEHLNILITGPTGVGNHDRLTTNLGT